MKALSRALLAAVVASSACWASASETVTHPFVGVTWTSRVEATPRPLRIHVVDVDLAAPCIRLRLTPQTGPLHTRKQTTLQYLQEQNAQIAVNAHFFEPWPPPSLDPGTANLLGIAASDGHVYAPFLEKPPKPHAIQPNAPGLNIDPGGRASIVHRNPADPSGYAVAERVTLHTALAGNEQIVTDGRVTAVESEWNRQLAPRTAIGLTAGQHLILVVVDGRQLGISEGMRVPELAELMVRQYAVVDALNLDGGGSTTLAIADPVPCVVNVPVGIDNVVGTQRPVGSNLAVFARRGEPAAGAQSDSRLGSSLLRHTYTACWAVCAVLACLTVGLVLRRCRRRAFRTRRHSR